MLPFGGFLLALPLLAAVCHVVAAHAQQTADAESITIESDLQTADKRTGVITASGNVRLVHAGRGLVATSRQAQFFTEEDRIVLSVDVDVIQANGNQLRADRFTYLLDEGRAIASPFQASRLSVNGCFSPANACSKLQPRPVRWPQPWNCRMSPSPLGAVSW